MAAKKLDNETQTQHELEEIEFDYHTKKHEEGEGNWLVSYADMMTLLVGFFVMLQSFSKVDANQFEKIKRETTKTFGGEYKVPFEKFSKELKSTIASENLSEQIKIQEDANGVVLTFRGALFFDSGSTVLKPEAGALIQKLIPSIQKFAKGFGIVVEGHTDNTPIKSVHIPSNWELSSNRACTVLRLFEEAGFDRTKIKALGWGDTKPIAPNQDAQGVNLPENQSQNRRVVIKIIKDFEG